MELQTKLTLALIQVENISNLITENEYERFFVSHLVPVKCELERQLANLTGTNRYSTIEEIKTN
jgi:hypothetical protein